MNLEKALKNTNRAILFWIINMAGSFIITIIMSVTILPIILDPNFDPDTFQFGYIIPFGLALLAFSVIGIVYLVYYILTMVDASKDQEDKTNFILLIVGLFVGIVGIIGLFLFRSRLQTLINQQNPVSYSQEQEYYRE